MIQRVGKVQVGAGGTICGWHEWVPFGLLTGCCVLDSVITLL